MNNIGIRNVARLAGVSESTVSKVLKNYPNISEKTRQKVMQVIKETGYIPNAIASNLSSKAKNRIALYVYINDKFQQIDEIDMLYLMGAFDVARKLNLELITVFHDSIDHLSKEEYAAYFMSRSVDVIVIFGLNKEDEKMHYLLENTNFKFVVIDAPIHKENVSSLYVDHTKGQYEVAGEIVKKNDKVLYLAGKENGYVTDMRMEGIKKLAEERNCKLDIEFGDFSEQKAYDIVKKKGKKYDDIVCASDLMAIGARKALDNDSEVRVSGFDGIRLMGYVCEDVITCRQDFYQIGRHAVYEADNLKQGKETNEIIVPYKITKIKYKDIIS
ncbi:MAG: LacI family DNA-binding transcriptional regulator [Erysipelotrichaceae bacterium]|nr:LacI family DNA-binding transcriptional regulator [Erysipelotrichaceae bacterium]